ncbi:hypothetical protein [Paracoccus sp. PARArs4]|nr:hypothetical protein [Paracoccus sp. PARArs4]
MTNKIAFALVLLIAATFAIDAIWFDGMLPLTAARTLDRFIEYLSFWR